VTVVEYFKQIFVRVEGDQNLVRVRVVAILDQLTDCNVVLPDETLPQLSEERRIDSKWEPFHGLCTHATVHA
jgi:hypothetical protein